MDIAKCPKCNGCVVRDTFSFSSQWVPGVRCLNCGRIEFDEEKVKQYADQTKDRGTDRMDELELYRTRRRSPKCYSHHIQH
jgi:hypothetical protein